MDVDRILNTVEYVAVHSSDTIDVDAEPTTTGTGTTATGTPTATATATATATTAKKDKWHDTLFVQPIAKRRKVQSSYVICRKCKSKHLLEAGRTATVDFEWYCSLCMPKVAVVCDGCDEEFSLDESGLSPTFDGVVVPQGEFYCVKCSVTTHTKQAAEAESVQLHVTTNGSGSSNGTSNSGSGLNVDLSLIGSGSGSGERKKKKSVFTPNIASKLIHRLIADRSSNTNTNNNANTNANPSIGFPSLASL